MPAKVQLFLGYIQNTELKIILKKNTAWQTADLLGTTGLCKCSYQQKDYLGILLDMPLTYGQLKQHEITLQAQLAQYGIELDGDKYKVSAFPQVILF